MRVVYRVLRPRRPGAPLTYQQAEPVKRCCADMARWWGNLIGFGVRDVPASTSAAVNLWRDRPQANGRTILEVVPIQRCPWCGEPIETCRAAARGLVPALQEKFANREVDSRHSGQRAD
jgi:hypothetical protein